MPIGVGIGGAVLGAGASIYSSSKASKAQSKAAGQAADTSLQVARENNELYRDIYDQNYGLLKPWEERGALASYALTDLLLGTNQFQKAMTKPATPARPAATPGALGGYAPANPGTPAMPIRPNPTREYTEDRGIVGGPRRGAGGFVAPRGGALAGTRPPGTPTTPRPSTHGAPSALSAWDQFRQGTNYQWRLNEGAEVLNSKYATGGAFESGAADKAAIEYGQNFASNELSNYMNLLAGQQSMGLNAAGAVAGVGNTYTQGVVAQNTNAGNVAANAALANGQGQANMWGSIGQGVGALGGALYQYGMGQMPQAQYGAASPIVMNPNTSSGGGNVNWIGGW